MHLQALIGLYSSVSGMSELEGMGERAIFTRMKGILPIVVMLALAGGATNRPMLPTPAIYVDQKERFFEDVPAALRTPEVDVLYVTDRQPEQDDAGNLRYGYGRSKSVAFGSVVVGFGNDLTWDDLVKVTRTSASGRPIELSVRSIEEIGRFPAYSD
jgi:hypothetical protein